VVLLTGSLNLTINIESQKIVMFLFPLFPLFIIFFIGCIAETNRAPFDLAEAESELVSGFMTEHSAAIFVFFFLAEYASIVLICIFTSILFLGGYLTILPFFSLLNLMYSLYLHFYYIDILNFMSFYFYYMDININIFIVMFQGLMSSLYLGIKSCTLIFVFILVRASYPRIRFDQLMSYC
jgi:NADH-ubiquinone oxidoreductase chain 1